MYKYIVILPAICLMGAGQTITASLSSANAAPGNAVSLNLQISAPSGLSPAALQWTVNTTSAITNVTATIGSAAGAASKSLSCQGYTCLLAGMNANAIANGAVASVTLQLAAAATGNVTVQLSNVSAVSPAGASIPVTTSSGVISVIPAVSVGVSPSTVTLTNAQTANIVATVSGTSNQAVTWTATPANVGTLANGLYTAPANITAAQTVTVTATSQADPTKFATATVNLVPTVGVSLTPASVTLAARQSQAFTASVSGTGNQAVTWTVSPANVGTLTNGLYTAPANIPAIQTVTITATSQADPTKFARTTVNLIPPVAVSLTPPTVTLAARQSQLFAASVSGVSNQAVTWTVSPANVGTFSNGLYTAPANITTAQTVTITATSQVDTTKSATATVSLTKSSNRFSDFDGNGVPDLVWQSEATRQVTVHYYGGSGGITDQGWNWLLSGMGASGWHVAATGDFNGDGLPDLVWQNDATSQVTVHYYGGPGGATDVGWNWLYADAGGVGWHVVAAADFNGDGEPDLVWQNDTTRQVTVHYYGGAGGATDTGWNWLYPGTDAAGWRVVAAADFNNDGVPDLVWQNDVTSQVTVHYYGGPGGASDIGWNWLYPNMGAAGWKVKKVADFNGDGVPDLIWQCSTTGQVTVHYYGGPGGAQDQGWNWLFTGNAAQWSVK